MQLVGRDIDPQAVRAARKNLAAAGLKPDIEQGDAFRFRPSGGPGLLLLNPPYGERLERLPDLDALLAIYRGWSAVLLLPQDIRLREAPKRSIEVFNGPLRARIAVMG